MRYYGLVLSVLTPNISSTGVSDAWNSTIRDIPFLWVMKELSSIKMQISKDLCIRGSKLILLSY